MVPVLSYGRQTFGNVKNKSTVFEKLFDIVINVSFIYPSEHKVFKYDNFF